jgi:long-chain acyl-CoA synthetase
MVEARNFYERFEQSVAQWGQRTAVAIQRRDTVESYTYRELREMAERVAGHLEVRGVRPGERCAILGDNDPRWVAAYLGALRLGAVALPLDTAYKAKQIATLLKDSGALFIFTTHKFLDAVREAVAQSGAPVEVALLFGAEPGLASLDDIVKGPAPALPPSPATSADAAVMLYSSGTTGNPKGVVLTHGNLNAESYSVFERITVHPTDSLLGVLPLFHALAQMANLLLPLIVGASVVYLEQINTTELLRALRERGITIFVCVPQFFYLIHQRVMQQVAAAGAAKRVVFRALLRTNGFLRRALRINLGPKFFKPVHAVLGEKMRLLVTGGSRFDTTIGADLYALGFNIIQAYGLTECSGAATVMHFGDPHLGAVGHPLKGVEIRIVPPPEESRAGEEQRGPAGEPVGEVLIRGGIVMQGYYNRPDANAATLRDGWLYTGDLGYLDADGRLYITGRAKEMIVTSSGKNIYPEEIEAHYLQSPFIKECCVLGIAPPNEPAAERLHAVVVPNFEVMRQRKVLNAKEVLRFEIESLSVQLPSHKRVLSYEIWNEELPRTTTRKLKRFQIAARVNAEVKHGESSAAAATRSVRAEDEAWAAQPQVARALAVITEAARHKAAVHPEANLELELGLDSMERVELLTRLEQMFGAQVPDEVSNRIYIVRELVDAVLAAAPGGVSGADAAPAAAGKDAWGRLLRELPDDDPAFNGLLVPKPFFSVFEFCVLKLFYAAAWLLLGLRVRGRERLPASGPFLLCPNHQSYLDAFLLISALPYRVMRRMFFVGASEYFATPLRRWLAREVNVVPVDPDTNLTKAMQAGAFGLKNGMVLILFPEGERSIDGKIKKFKKGGPILSLHLGAAIVPAALEGAYEVWPRGKGFQWSAILNSRGRPPLRLTFGEPLPAPPRLPENVSFSEAEAAYSSAAERLRASVGALAPGLLG